MRLALGTVQFGLDYGVANEQGQVPGDEAREIIRHARSSGMDTLDTAMLYGDSEQRLGEIGLKGWHVVSKLPAVPEGCPDVHEWADSSVQESLARLRIKSLYGLLLHRPDQLLTSDGESVYRALLQLRVDGVVRKIGVSIYDPSELDELCDRYRFDVVQAPFNLLDRRLIDTGWLSRLAALGTEVHVRSVFLQGLLLMSNSSRPAKFERWEAIWVEFERWLNESEVTPLQACLRHALSFPEISRVIVGVDRLDHLMQILHAADGVPPPISTALKTSDPDLLNPSRWAVMS